MVWAKGDLCVNADDNALDTARIDEPFIVAGVEIASVCSSRGVYVHGRERTRTTEVLNWRCRAEDRSLVSACAGFGSALSLASGCAQTKPTKPLAPGPASTHVDHNLGRREQGRPNQWPLHLCALEMITKNQTIAQKLGRKTQSRLFPFFRGSMTSTAHLILARTDSVAQPTISQPSANNQPTSATRNFRKTKAQPATPASSKSEDDMRQSRQMQPL